MVLFATKNARCNMEATIPIAGECHDDERRIQKPSAFRWGRNRAGKQNGKARGTLRAGKLTGFNRSTCTVATRVQSDTEAGGRTEVSPSGGQLGCCKGTTCFEAALLARDTTK